MRFSIILLSCMVVVFGILPGIPLKAINSIGVFFGFESLRINVWGITSETETLSMVNIFIAVLIATGIVWILFRAGYKKVNITQEDNYAAGAHISRDKYHYTADFYNPLCGMIKPYLKDFSNEFYSVIIKAGRILSDRTRKIYSGDLSYYVLYIVLFLGFLIILKIGLKLW
jgi:small-conductance mechanosensitive channel